MKRDEFQRIVSAALIVLLIFAVTRTGFAADSELEARNRLVAETRRTGVNAAPTLIAALNDERKIVRLTAAHLLIAHGDPGDEILLGALDNDDVQVRRLFAGYIARSGRLLRFVKPLVLDRSAVVRRYFYLKLMPEYLLVDGRTPSELIDELASAFWEADEDLQIKITEVLSELPYSGDAPDQVIAFLSSAYPDTGSGVRKAIVAALGEMPVTDSSAAKLREVVAAADEDYAEDALIIILESKVEEMGRLAEKEKWQDLVDKFGDLEIDGWPDTDARLLFGRRHRSSSLAGEAHFRLGTAYYNLGRGEKAANELKKCLERHTGAGTSRSRSGNFIWFVLEQAGANYLENLDDKERAAEVFASAYSRASGTALWRIMHLVLHAVDILCDLDKCDDAVDVFEAMDTARLSDVTKPWRFQYRYFTTYAKALNAVGRRREARLQYEQALEMEGLSDSQKDFLKETLDSLKPNPEPN